MMDHPQYVEKALLKIDLYQRNGILPGRQLILTHETGKRALSTKKIDAVINAYLL